MEKSVKKRLEALYEKEAVNVYKYIYHLCGDRELAEDITQETFLKAAGALKKFRGQCREMTWLCQIARHLLYAEWRKKKNVKAGGLLSREPADEQDVEAVILQMMERMEWFQKLQGLDAVTREVVYLRIYCELSFREIGEMLDRTENWARVTFYRGKQKLKGACEHEQTGL